MESTGHLAGMLDRDQRTIRTKFLDFLRNVSDKIVPNIVTDCFDNRTEGVLCATMPKKRTYCYFSKWRQHRYYSKTSFKNLQNILLVVFYLILVAVPSVWSASIAGMGSRTAEQPKWVTPCGQASMLSMEANTPDYIREPDVLNQTVEIAKIALGHAEDFFRNYTSKTFKNQEIDNYLRNQHNDWMMAPASFERSRSENNDDSLKHDDTLLDAYEYLQSIAVGLEQAVWDQEPNGPFLKEFTDCQNYERVVLCEIQTALIERGIAMRKDIDRDIMSERVRRLNSTETRQRDYIILRDYIQALQFIINSFSHKT